VAAVKLKVELLPYRIPLVNRFRTGWGDISERRGVIAVAESPAGHTGHGEIAPLPGFSPDTLDEAVAGAGEMIEAMIAGIEKSSPLKTSGSGKITTSRSATGTYPDNFTEMESWFRKITDELSPPPSTLFGLSTMVADLGARTADLTLADWMVEPRVEAVPVNGVCSGEIETLHRQIPRLTKSGFKVVKLKVGGVTPAEELDRIDQVLTQLPPHIRLRLDANRKWSFPEALQVLAGVDPTRIELVEEPLHPDYQDQLEKLHSATGIGFALDETVLDRRRWRDLLSCRAITAVVLKPTLIGDLWQVRELGSLAIGAGKGIIVTTTFETGIGTAACHHLAATFGDHLLPCGLDTLHYLQKTLIVEHLNLVDGDLRFTPGAGLGITFDPAALSDTGGDLQSGDRQR
jgi:o-succinylbenzoate synthase